MPTHREICCAIEVNGSLLQEYQGGDEYPKPHVIQTSYVEAQDSATFSFRCGVLPGYQFAVGGRVSFRVYINGNEICRESITKERRDLTLEGPVSVDKSGREAIYPFQFARVSLVEDHDSEVQVDPSSLATMGEISVYALRTSRVGVKLYPQPITTPKVTSFESVNEKALKGKDLTHTTRLGPKEERGYRRPRVKTKKHDSIESPFVHFRFRYRSKRALQNLGLIPRTPTRSLPPLVAQNTSAGEKAMEQEIARLRVELESRDNKSSIKREIKEEGCKGIPQPKRLKLSKVVTEVETIDLTGDD